MINIHIDESMHVYLIKILVIYLESVYYWSHYREASSRGAYEHDPFWSVFEEHRLDSTTTYITMALFIL